MIKVKIITTVRCYCEWQLCIYAQWHAHT